MSCFDWSRLLEHRGDSGGTPSANWAAARRHLDHCGACRREAMALDPTLVFRDAAPWAPASSDVEAIRVGVATLRRTRELAAGERGGRKVERRRGLHGRAAAALLFATILALQADSTARTSLESAGPGATIYDARLQQPASPAAPAIEGLDRPQARVYEWGADDLSVVMVVDESLDV